MGADAVHALPDPRPRFGYHELHRRLAEMVHGLGPVDAPPAPLEVLAAPPDVPRLIQPAMIEPGAMRAHRVAGMPTPRFAAFLDGTQTSRVLGYCEGAPVVFGTSAAVIRTRRNRRMGTWRTPLVVTRVYAVRDLLTPTWREALNHIGVPVVDAARAAGDANAGVHPIEARDWCVYAVQRDRESLERELAERWCALQIEPLFVDGGISGSEAVARSPQAVGVVKSHRTLYAQRDALQVVCGLRAGERSSVFRVTSPRRTSVASWYLRIRENLSSDPLWGLVRVEVSDRDSWSESRGAGTVHDRTDEISRWVLAETSPLSLPDRRWDTLAYGIHDCEEFLKAVV